MRGRRRRFRRLPDLDIAASCGKFVLKFSKETNNKQSTLIAVKKS
jgi:hypothetical protein